MGCNYYLRRHCKLTDDDLPMDIEVLTNGFVWKNTFYADLSALNKIYYEELHLGKSSAGWLFLLQGYSSKTFGYTHAPNYLNKHERLIQLNSIEDWLAIINSEAFIGIYDENNALIDLASFMQVFNRDSQPDRTNIEDRLTATECKSNFKGLYYSVYDDGLSYYKNVPYRISYNMFC